MNEGVFKNSVENQHKKQIVEWLSKGDKPQDGEVDLEQAQEALESFLSDSNVEEALKVLWNYTKSFDYGPIVTSYLITKFISYMRNMPSNMLAAHLCIEILGNMWNLYDDCDMLLDQELIKTVLMCGLVSRAEPIECAAFRSLVSLCESKIEAVEFLCCESVMNEMGAHVFTNAEVSSACAQGCLHLLSYLVQFRHEDVFLVLLDSLFEWTINSGDIDVAAGSTLVLSRLLKHIRIFHRFASANYDKNRKAIADRLVASTVFHHKMNLYVLLAEIRMFTSYLPLFETMRNDIVACAAESAAGLFDYLRMWLMTNPREAYDNGLIQTMIAAHENMCYENRLLTCFAILDMMNGEFVEDKMIGEIMANGGMDIVCSIGMTLEADQAACFVEVWKPLLLKEAFKPMLQHLLESGVLEYFLEIARETGNEDLTSSTTILLCFSKQAVDRGSIF